MRDRQAKAIILGCGSSGGVPRVDGYWGNCNPENPKNRRSRCSLYFTVDDKNIIIDTSPDMRMHVLREGITTLDGVLFTHDHADQCHGIDDVRAFTFLRSATIPAYADAETAQVLDTRFNYIFHGKPNSGYPPIMRMTVADDLFHMQEIDADIYSFKCPHGSITARGFVIGDMAYSPDVHHIEQKELNFLKAQKLDMWVVDCLRYTPHTTHAHFDLVMEWLDYVAPERMILTNLHFDLDYDILTSKLPQNVEAAYDGMRFGFKI
ncbi:MAG: MBL fold metallo-hydrolase [Pseudomonadota bacterium]